jgi:hypothetical protein
MNDKIKELIELYEAILHGDKNSYGLFDCYDAYYRGCWDEKLKKVENLKKEFKAIKKALNIPPVICITPICDGLTFGVEYKVLAKIGEDMYVIEDDDEYPQLVGKSLFK